MRATNNDPEFPFGAPKNEQRVKSLDLPNGDRIVLVDRLSEARTLERARNVHRINNSGHIVWTIATRFDSECNPFTQLHFDDGRLTAYRWDGGTYTVDVDTGFAEPRRLDR